MTHQSAHGAPSSGPPRSVLPIYTVLLLAQAALSLGGIFGRFALQEVGSLQVPATRLTLTCLPLLARAALGRAKRLHRRVESYLGLAGIALGLGFAGWGSALSMVSVGAATLLSCTSPFWAAIFEAVLQKKAIPRAFWPLLAIALGCIAVMFGDNSGMDWNDRGRVARGLSAGALSGLAGGGYLVVVQHVSRRPEVGTLDVITRTFSYAALTLIALCVFGGQRQMPPLDHWRPWLALLAMAVVTQGAGHVATNFTLQRVRPSVVGTASLLQPIISAVAASWLFGESLSWRFGASGVALIAAVGIILKMLS